MTSTTTSNAVTMTSTEKEFEELHQYYRKKKRIYQESAWSYKIWQLWGFTVLDVL